MTDHLIQDVQRGVGILTLNRSRALNALSLDMIRSMTEALLAWRDDPNVDTIVFRGSTERAFCAGGDIRFFHQAGTGSVRDGSALLEDFFTEEYFLNYLIHTCPKPTIALMDGIVMGGGMGIAQGCSLRVVTERSKIGMPETAIGLFPDVGGSYFLSRTPHFYGRWLALTGEAAGSEEAVASGLADMQVQGEALPELMDTLIQALPQQRLDAVRRYASAPSSNHWLARHRDDLQRHFGLESAQAIVHSLVAEQTEFASHTLAAMRLRSPLMVHVTLEQLRRGAHMNLADCLRMERTMVRHCFTHGEVVEGIRARVIDKDNAPVWQHKDVESVRPEEFLAFFDGVWPAHAHPLRMLA